EEGAEPPIFNFLMCAGGGVQFAFSYPGSRPGSTCWNGLHYVVRKPPFKSASLIDVDYNIDFANVTSEEDQVAVIATKPLTDDEEWVEFERNELILFEAGVPYSNTLDCGCGDGAAATPELRPIELLAADDGDPCNPLLHTPTRMKELRRSREEGKEGGRDEVPEITI
ncbi:hypothetical protein TeGR_g8363, partial [Tetraparma gracilis]